MRTVLTGTVCLKFLSMFRCVLKYRSMHWQLHDDRHCATSLKLAHWLMDWLTEWLIDWMTAPTQLQHEAFHKPLELLANIQTCAHALPNWCVRVCVCAEISMFSIVYLQHRHDYGLEPSEARISDCTMIIEAYYELNRQADRGTDRRADRQTGRRQTDRQADGQTDEQTDRQTSKQTDRRADRQMNQDWEIVRLSVRPGDGRTDRRTVGLRQRWPERCIERTKYGNAKSLNSETQRN